MNMKKFNVSFFQAVHQDDIPPAIAADLLAPFIAAEQAVFEHSGHRYVIVVTRISPGCYKGEFKRFGHDDLPHAGRLEGGERELEIAHDEMTIERNYFLFFQQRKLLVWQENKRSSTALMFAHYMSNMLGFAVSFAPVLTPDATRTLLLGQHRAKAIEFSVARPVNAHMYEGADDSAPIMRMLAGLGGMTGSFRISANAQGVRGRFLEAARVMGLGSALVESGNARKVMVELDGVDHPVDLIVDRLRTKIHVEMDGRYPIPASIYSSLQGARDRVAEELNAIFG